MVILVGKILFAIYNSKSGFFAKERNVIESSEVKL
jgi:hypothetical protein